MQMPFAHASGSVILSSKFELETDMDLTRLGRDSMAFLPELVLSGIIVLLLLVRLFKIFDKVHLSGVAMIGVLGGAGH